VANCRLADTLEREESDCAWEAPQDRPRSASEEQAESLLQGVRLMLAEESLSQLWEGCLRPKSAVHAVVDCWASALNYN